MSDIDDEINAMNEESGDGSGLVGSKEGYNYLDTGINGDTKGL